jgi:hypothetical protein
MTNETELSNKSHVFQIQMSHFQEYLTKQIQTQT